MTHKALLLLSAATLSLAPVEAGSSRIEARLPAVAPDELTIDADGLSTIPLELDPERTESDPIRLFREKSQEAAEEESHPAPTYLPLLNPASTPWSC